MLKYYYSVWGFNSVELNFTYYRMPSYKTIVGMLRQVPGDMKFAIKAPGKVTHEFWHADQESVAGVQHDFCSAIEPMRQEGRLGPILFQFPWSFKSTEENRLYLERVADIFGAEDRKLVFEFRHDSWASGEILDFVKRISVIPATVDEPRLGNLFPYLPVCSSHSAYFRLHGRNPEWFVSEGSERYNYNYTDSDLRSFALDVLEFHERGLDVYVFFNNCYMGRAVNNALRLREIIGGA